jgi:hypothetical protein
VPRGRPRKASNVLELTGRFKINPDRKKARANEPTPDTAISSDPPEWMRGTAFKEERKCYREIIRNAHADVLSTADSVWVEIVACLLAEFRKAPHAMKMAKLARLQSGLSQLGMSPSDRSKAGKMPRKQENRFAQFGA